VPLLERAHSREHGDVVRVQEQQLIGGLRWCKVAGEIVVPEGEEQSLSERSNGGRRTLKGWLRASLLLNAGAAEYGR